MLSTKISEYQNLQSQIQGLEATIETERTKELKALPAKYGFDSLTDFIKALKAASSTPARKRRAKSSPKGAKGKRVKITPEIKEKVKSAIEAGQTGSKIAGDLGISLASVQNVKKEFGLVKARG